MKGKPVYKTLMFLLILYSNILSEEWQVNKNKDNQVVFHSKTTLLDFEGTTENVDGYLLWEGDSLFKGKNEVFFEVYLASFKTGIGKRDSDMREDVLETDKYPVATFKGRVFLTKQLKESIFVKAEGTLSLHGITKSVTIEAYLYKSKDDNITVKSSFSVFLKDHNIDAPTLMAFVKVAQEIKIDVMLNLMKVN